VTFDGKKLTIDAPFTVVPSNCQPAVTYTVTSSDNAKFASSNVKTEPGNTKFSITVLATDYGKVTNTPGAYNVTFAAKIGKGANEKTATATQSITVSDDCEIPTSITWQGTFVNQDYAPTNPEK
jgi:hypothetical protein